MTNNEQMADISSTLIGTFRRFGDLGPAYEILGRANKNEGLLLDIRVLDSGEKLTYPYQQALNDPEA